MALLLNVRQLAPLTYHHRPALSDGIGCSPPERTDSSATLVSTGKETTSSQDGSDVLSESASYQNPVFQDTGTETGWCNGSLSRSQMPVPSNEKKPDGGLRIQDAVVQIFQDISNLKSGSRKSDVCDMYGSKGVYSSTANLAASLVSQPQPQPPSRRKSSSGNTSTTKTKSNSSKDEDEESLFAICVQVFFPFLIAGIGTCGAGLLLDKVENWEAFKNITEIFILVPTLLGLKGNLEMTLASRVSTQVNLDKLDSWRDRWYMSWGNMTLLQCQATALSFLSSCFATALRSSREKSFDIQRALLLGASALFTASFASLVLGAITLGVVLVSHRFHVNPDNVATPIAASLGDVTTLGILAAITSYLYNVRDDMLPSSLFMGVIMLMLPVWMFLSYRNEYVKRVLFFGWTPIVVAVAITSAGGYILEFSISRFQGFAIFQPVINGVAGNLVAVQASRISTHFHKHCSSGSLPPGELGLCISPFNTFLGKNPHARAARVLLAMVVPGHLLFGYGITLIKGGDTVLTPTFLPIYLLSALLQVATLLYIAQCLIHFLWRWKVDPDNWAIPLLTALGDLSGMVVLTAAFFIHQSVT